MDLTSGVWGKNANVSYPPVLNISWETNQLLMEFIYNYIKFKILYMQCIFRC